MSRRNNSKKFNNKINVVITAIVMICLIVIYRFNFYSKSEKSNIITSVKFKDLASNEVVFADLELMKDEEGKTYIELPKVINNYFINEFIVNEEIKIPVVSNDTLKENLDIELNAEENNTEILEENNKEETDLNYSDENNKDEEITNELSNTIVEETTNEITNITNDEQNNKIEYISEKKEVIHSCGDKIYIEKKDLENADYFISFNYKKIVMNNVELYYQQLEASDEDTNINIIGFIPKNYSLNITKLEDKEAKSYIDDVEEFNDYSILKAYDLKIVNGNDEYQPKEYSQTVDVSFEANSLKDDHISIDTVEVIHVVEKENNDDVILEKIDVKEASDDLLSFKTDEFSKYIAVSSITDLPSGLGTDDKGITDRYTVNNYAQKYNYYIGLNFTESTSYQNLYNDNNLARVTINYYSYDRHANTDPENGGDPNYYERRGNLSVSEPYKKVTYVECAPIVNNKISLELIDNPFVDFYYDHDELISDQSYKYSYAFGGWVASESDSSKIKYTINTDTNNYIQTLIYDGNSKDITINLRVDWVSANVVFLDTYNYEGFIDGSKNHPYNNLKDCYADLNYRKSWLPNNSNASPRERSIIVLKNGNVVLTTADSENLPVTFTSVYYNTDYRNNNTYLTINNNYKCVNDLHIHDINLVNETRNYNNIPSGNTARGTFSNFISAETHNLRLGRNIGNADSDKDGYLSFASVAGFYAINKNDVTNASYKLVIESGKYNNVFQGSGCVGDSGTSYEFKANNYYSKLVIGNDLDRILGNNQTLKISTKIGARSDKGTYSSIAGKNLFEMVIKSGEIGLDYTNKYKEYVGSTTYENVPYAGIYVGGFGTGNSASKTGGSDTGNRVLYVEGGLITNIIGGLKTYSTSNANTMIYMLGGNVYNIVGGAGRSVTYGDRKIQITGGLVSYNVFGGSNGFLADSGNTGDLTGNTTVYVGGDAQIGDDETTQNTLYGAYGGNVFGSGNGKDTKLSGSVTSSRVIIDGGALVKNSVYAAGNFAYCGNSSSGVNSKVVSKVEIIGGTIEKNIYGGSNQNKNGGSNEINISGGITKGTIYGGCNTSGTLYGNATINVSGGTVGELETGNAIFGGGYGSATIVNGTVKINVNDDFYSPIINGKIYGGSAKGTVCNVQGNSVNISIKDYKKENENVTINGMIFGGGEGEQGIAANVKGNVNIEVNGGDYPNLKVFGCNNVNGIINGTVIIKVGENYLTNLAEIYNGGQSANITNTTSSLTTTLYSNAVVNRIFGGGNEAGVYVDESSPSATNTKTVSNINIKGATVDDAIYAGSNSSGTMFYCNITASEKAFINNIFGGGKGPNTSMSNYDSRESGQSFIKIDGANVLDLSTDGTGGYIFGGSEKGKVYGKTIIEMDKSYADYVYGGGLEGTTYGPIEINYNGAIVLSTYGGGKRGPISAYDSKCKIAMNIKASPSNNAQTLITSLYGGGEEADADMDVDIKVTDDAQVVNIFGGGDKGVVKRNVNLEINNALIYQDIYGGGNAANVEGDVNLTAKNCKILGDIYCGGNNGEIGSTTNKRKINLTLDENVYIGSGDPDDKSNVYGGGKHGTVYGETILNLSNSTIEGSVYCGGESANVDNVIANLDKMDIQESFYGAGDLGNITQNVIIDIKDSNIAKSVYGGGNGSTNENEFKGGVQSNVSLRIYGTDSGTNIGGSVYGGGNGASASVKGNVTVLVDGIVDIAENVFGGGNSSITGTNLSNSDVLVNIAGGNIGGNVYGGANASSIKGNTTINIGTKAISDNTSLTDYNKNNINIKGTIYGGGEMMSKETFSASDISVTGTINLYIDGSNYDANQLVINGSVFGSGHSSNTETNGNVYIRNFGNSSDVKKLISIQRANEVKIHNSYLRLAGTTDSTAYYSNISYAFNIIAELRLSGGTTLYLRNGANKLAKYTSAVYETGNELETVSISEDGLKATTNVDNRIYMFNGKNLNISNSENLSTYGIVKGMTFFGIFTDSDEVDESGNVSTVYNTGMYSKDYEMNKVGNQLSWNERNFDRCYAVGAHADETKYLKDGFYSVFEDVDDSIPEEETLTEENYKAKSYLKIIVPTPDADIYYLWAVGPDEDIYYYNFDLTASKFSSLGTYEMNLIGLSYKDAYVRLETVDTSKLSAGVTFENPNDIPSINPDKTKANKQLGLSMESGVTGWSMTGKTNYYSDDDKNTSYDGTSVYKFDSSFSTPSFKFYLYHANNINQDLNLGSINIRMKVFYWESVDKQAYSTISITINLSTMVLDEVGYNGAITPGTQYRLFTNNQANITSKSSFSSFFQLSEDKFFENKKINQYYKDAFRVINTGSFVFPKDTTITMIDYSADNDPQYYYYDVTQQDVQSGKTRFKFSDFLKMGTIDVKYNEKEEEEKYKRTITDEQTGEVHEYEYEYFVFIVDFEHADFSSYSKDGKECFTENQSFYIELRYKDDKTGAEDYIAMLNDGQILQNTYSIYDVESTISIEAELSKSKIYLGTPTMLNIVSVFDVVQKEGTTIYDTRFFNKKMGLKISFYQKDDKGNLTTISGADLLGTYFQIGEDKYSPRADGTIRIKVADLVSNITTSAELITTNSIIQSGNYVMHIESYGCADGQYYGIQSSGFVDVDIEIVNGAYGLNAILPENQNLISKNTKRTFDEEGRESVFGDDTLNFSFEYISGLTTPYMTVELFRREYDLKDTYGTKYVPVDIKEYFDCNFNNPQCIIDDQSFTVTENDKLIMERYNVFKEDREYEYTLFDTDTIISEAPDSLNPTTLKFNMPIKQDATLKTGTYKFVFTLYDRYTDSERIADNSTGVVNYKTYKFKKYEKIGEAFTYVLIK